MSEGTKTIISVILIGFSIYLFIDVFYWPWVVETLCEQNVLIPEYCNQ